MIRKTTVAAGLVLALSVATACAQGTPSAKASGRAPAGAGAVAARPAASGDAAIRASIAKAVPGAKIDNIGPSPIPGYREVAIAGKVVYVSADGKYLMQGALVDLATRDNLTEISEGALRRGQLDSVPRDRRIVFSPPNPKYRVTVFTDIDCGYCRKMHTHIADYMKAGISVEYLFFPRAGIGSESYKKAVSVWCAPDQRQALTDAKLDKPVKKRSCTNPVTGDYALGNRIGVEGTPAIYAADGTHLGGYMEPKEMLASLDRAAARAKAAVAAR